MEEKIVKAARRYRNEVNKSMGGLDVEILEQIEAAYLKGFEHGSVEDTSFTEFISSIELGINDKNLVRGVYYDWFKYHRKND